MTLGNPKLSVRPKAWDVTKLLQVWCRTIGLTSNLLNALDKSAAGRDIASMSYDKFIGDTVLTGSAVWVQRCLRGRGIVNDKV